MSFSPRRRPAARDASDERPARSVAGHGVPDELMNRALAGDPDAVEALIAIIRPLVKRYCRARLGRVDRSDVVVDDVVQEVCLAVLTALPGYRSQGRPFLAFVYGVASQKVVDAFRATTRNRPLPVADVPVRVDATDGPEQHVLRAELTSELSRLLGTLPEKQREILVLRVLVGLSAEETAEAVGSTPGAVRVAQHRALAQLRVKNTEGGAAPPDVVELLAELDEPLRQGYLAYIESLASALDLDAGLAHLEERHGHRHFVAGLAGQLNLDAGLDALLRSTETDRP
jgi:RNA polymerase sigma-70 factor (ECF subfamily)